MAYEWFGNRPVYDGDWDPPIRWIGTSFATRRKFFETHESHCNDFYVCPACGYPTLHERYFGDYCDICCWEYDGQDDPWSDQINGGPNDSSLDDARKNFEVTSCAWSFEQRDEFGPWQQDRLFSEKAQTYKQRLRSLLDQLMTLTDNKDIADQWIRVTDLKTSFGNSFQHE